MHYSIDLSAQLCYSIFINEQATNRYLKRITETIWPHLYLSRISPSLDDKMIRFTMQTLQKRTLKAQGKAMAQRQYNRFAMEILCEDSGDYPYGSMSEPYDVWRDNQ